MDAAWRTHVHLAKSYSEDHSRHFGSPVRDNFKEDSHVHLAPPKHEGECSILFVLYSTTYRQKYRHRIHNYSTAATRST